MSIIVNTPLAPAPNKALARAKAPARVRAPARALARNILSRSFW